MKTLFKSIFLLFFMIASMVAFAQDKEEEQALGGVEFFTGSWEDAVAKAQKEDKYLMIDAYTDWCYWCKVMDKKTFSDSEVGDFFKENIVAYKMDMEKGRGILMAMKYRVTSFPTFLFFSSEGPLVSRVLGYVEPAPFLETLRDRVMNPDKQFKHPGDPAQLEVNFPDFYKLSFNRGKERKMPSDDQVLSFLSQQEDLFGEISWSVMSRFGFPGKYREHFLNHIDTYRELYGGEVHTQVETMVYRQVMNAAKEKNEEMLNEAIEMAINYSGAENAESIRLAYLMAYDQRAQNWEAYGEHALEAMELDTEKNNSQINSYAWNIYLHVENEELVKEAASWMEKVVADEPSYAYLDTYAALLYKGGDLKKAEKYAKKAIEVGKKDGEKVEETEALLEKIRE